MPAISSPPMVTKQLIPRHLSCHLWCQLESYYLNNSEADTELSEKLKLQDQILPGRNFSGQAMHDRIILNHYSEENPSGNIFLADGRLAHHL